MRNWLRKWDRDAVGIGFYLVSAWIAIWGMAFYAPLWVSCTCVGFIVLAMVTIYWWRR